MPSWMPLFVGRFESESLEMCAARALEHLRDFLGTPPTIPESLAIGFPMLHRCPSLYFCFGFLVYHASFRIVTSLLLDLKMWLMSPTMAMQRMNSNQNLTTIQGQQEVRRFPFSKESSSLV